MRSFMKPKGRVIWDTKQSTTKREDDKNSFKTQNHVTVVKIKPADYIGTDPEQFAKCQSLSLFRTISTLELDEHGYLTYYYGMLGMRDAKLIEPGSILIFTDRVQVDENTRRGVRLTVVRMQFMSTHGLCLMGGDALTQLVQVNE